VKRAATWLAVAFVAGWTLAAIFAWVRYIDEQERRDGEFRRQFDAMVAAEWAAVRSW
jgi:hypothetical protein